MVSPLTTAVDLGERERERGREGQKERGTERELSIRLQGDYGEKVSLQDETSPCSELKEKFKCIEYIGRDEQEHRKRGKIRP